jgi:hypothetical protein
MTVIDLLCHLREQLVSLREANNQDGLRNLWGGLQLILESAYKYQDKDVAAILEEMEDAIRDSLMGVEWKSNVPSVESIKALED